MDFKAIDSFYPRANELRRVFDKKFADPLRGSNERFVWDYWHVPNEYTLLRTPAYAYFGDRLYAHFHNFLVNWGRVNLGCHDVSPPWLSCYIDGCRQEPHEDVPHGPLAFVFSLTDWRGRAFTGGETFIKKPRALIEPKFNRLTLFNPALTHGVRRVRGTHDPREGRLVIHGWFVNPRPFWTGPLTADDVREAVETQLAGLGDPNLRLGRGLVSLRLNITPGGKVGRVTTLVETLRGGRASDVNHLNALVARLTFPKRKTKSILTLPLTID